MMSDLIFRLRLRQDAEIDSNYLHRLLLFLQKQRDLQIGWRVCWLDAKYFENKIEYRTH